VITARRQGGMTLLERQWLSNDAGPASAPPPPPPPRPARRPARQASRQFTRIRRFIYPVAPMLTARVILLQLPVRSSSRLPANDTYMRSCIRPPNFLPSIQRSPKLFHYIYFLGHMSFYYANFLQLAFQLINSDQLHFPIFRATSPTRCLALLLNFQNV
jgi:hypothetical protein